MLATPDMPRSLLTWVAVMVLTEAVPDSTPKLCAAPSEGAYANAGAAAPIKKGDGDGDGRSQS